MQHRIVFKYLSGRKRGTSEVFALPRFASELKIGRDPICEVRFDPLADTAVSRHHASLQWTDEEPRSYSIVDLLSSNGTFVNSRRVENSAPLKDGDIVEFGRGGPTARVEIQAEGGFDVAQPPATKTMDKAPLAVEHTMKHKIIKF
jgi:pSer/pThr/pTyr-binding forkhead associated (FHA) protein